MARIIQALWNLERAGTERVVFELSKAIQSASHDVHVITLSGGGAMESDFRDAGIPVTLGPKTRDRRALISFLEKQLQLHKPDLIHTHLGADLWMTWAATRQKIKPIISTVHNVEERLPMLYHQARRLAYGRMEKVVCVSDTVKQFVEKKYHVAAKKTQTIRLGIDLNQIHPRGSRMFPDIPRLVSIGRLTAQKDHATLIRALARLKRPWTLEIYGAGEQEHTLKRLATELNLLSRIRFLGVLPYEQVMERLSQADLFCFPSRFEGQGLGLLEAAAAGLPVLASDLPVFRETFTESSLYFAAAGNDLEWSRKIDHILHHPKEALQRASKAEAVVQQHFTLPRMNEEYLALYDSLLPSR